MSDDSHVTRAMKIAVEMRAGFETASRFVDWLFANFTDAELDERSMRELWSRWRDLEMSK